MYATPASSNPDYRLLQQIAAGDKTAFTKLFHEFSPFVLDIAVMLLHDRDLAEDTVQDLFLKLWLKREQLPEIKNIKNWLFILTRNACKNVLRSLARADKKAEGYMDRLPDFVDESDERLSADHYQALVGQAMAQLTEQQRKVFDYSVLQGYNRKETAELLGLSPNTVKLHLMRAIRIVRAYLIMRMSPNVLIMLSLATIIF